MCVSKSRSKFIKYKLAPHNLSFSLFLHVDITYQCDHIGKVSCIVQCVPCNLLCTCLVGLIDPLTNSWSAMSFVVGNFRIENPESKPVVFQESALKGNRACAAIPTLESYVPCTEFSRVESQFSRVAYRVRQEIVLAKIRHEVLTSIRAGCAEF